MVQTTMLDRQEKSQGSFDVVKDMISFFYANKSVYDRCHGTSEEEMRKARMREFNALHKGE